MAEYPDLEISLHGGSLDSCYVELRFTQPNSDADIAPARGVAKFDAEALRATAHDPAAHGEALGAGLFADRQVWRFFNDARATSQSLNLSLRIRLSVDAEAPEFHSLRWETLRDPQDGLNLLAGENVLFSRYVSSPDWRPVRLRPRGDLQALVVIASPTNIAEYKPGDRLIPPLDVQSELERAHSALGTGSITVTALASGGTATLDNLVSNLREGYDILYLVCHTALIDGKPLLWLEGSVGEAAVVAGDDLAARLSELQVRPRLVVLAPCQSAGIGEEAMSADSGAPTVLGPRLAETGIPAILAFQDNVSMRTVEEFMPVFFRELQRDGQVDRAMATARNAVRRRPDYWVPVLFIRLRHGRLWYVPGFSSEEFDSWLGLLQSISNGRCTPILGPDLTEALFGSQRDIARRWADAYGFPWATDDRDDLTKVAQYLAVRMDNQFVHGELQSYLRQVLLQRYGERLSEAQRNAALEVLLTEVGRLRRAEDPAEPHKILASLPFRVYITANPDNLLEDALLEAGKLPQVDLCRWNADVSWPPSIFERDTDFEPTVERPLVYHLLGHVQEPDSLVLTEDDYRDYLISVSREKDTIPPSVRRSLANSSLLLVGFQVNTQSFRDVFRSILSVGRLLRGRFANIAQVIDLDESSNLDTNAARRYLERYFGKEDFNIYWGSVRDFVWELQAHWKDGDRNTSPASPRKLRRQPERPREPVANNLPRSNPYVGPRPYVTGEKLYGRDRQTSELLSLLIAERGVLLYGPPGAGKTSLIEAALAPALEEESVQVLLAIRVSLPPPADADQGGTAANRYVLSVLLSLEDALPAEKRVPMATLLRMDLPSYLEQQWPITGERQALIFDQFEDALALGPSDRPVKEAFFSQLRGALSSSQRCALFAMRQEYLAELDPYRRYLPGRLSATYRLDPLTREEAREAIQRPAQEAGIDFTDAAAVKLVDDLGTVYVMQPDGTVTTQRSSYIEPLLLQVICRHLWEKLPATATQVTTSDLESASADSESVLADYYASQVGSIAAATGVPERRIRAWFEEHVTPSQGTSGQVLPVLETSHGLDNRAIMALVSAGLVRIDVTRGATRFELASNLLAQPIRTDNERWRATNLSHLQLEAARWETQNHPAALLMRGSELKEAQQWAADHKDWLTDTEIAFLSESARSSGDYKAPPSYQLSIIAPKQVTVGQQLNLQVELLPSAGGEGSFELPDGVVDLYCFVGTSGLRVEGANVATMPVDPRFGAISPTSFRLQASLRGERPYTVDLFTDDPNLGRGRRLFHGEGRIEVVAPPLGVERPSILPPLNVRIAPQTDFVLRVNTELLDREANRRRLTYRLTCRLPGMRLLDEEVGIAEFSDDDLSRIQMLLTRSLARTSNAQPEDAREYMLALGTYLYDQLFPAKGAAAFRQALQKAADRLTTWLILEDGATWLPWELVSPYYRDAEGTLRFVAERYRIGRWVDGLGATLYSEVPFGEIALAQYKVRDPQQAREDDDLMAWRELLDAQDAYGIARVAQPSEPFYGLHLLHHVKGTARREIVAREGPDGEVSAEKDASQAQLDLRRKRPVVTLSIIDRDGSGLEASGHRWLLPDRVLPFLRAGAGAVVAPWWPTSEVADQIFWSRFYDLLARRVPLGESVWRARLAVEQALPYRPDWLAYTLFGNPTARPYWPETAAGYASLECVNPDEPLRPGKTYTFRAIMSRHPPAEYRDRLVQAEDLPEGMRALFLAPDLQAAMPSPVQMVPVGKLLCQATVELTPKEPGSYPIIVQLMQGDEHMKTLQATIEVGPRPGGGPGDA